MIRSTVRQLIVTLPGETVNSDRLWLPREKSSSLHGLMDATSNFCAGADWIWASILGVPVTIWRGDTTVIIISDAAQTENMQKAPARPRCWRLSSTAETRL